MARIVTVRLMLLVDSDDAAFDATNEILREQQMAFAMESVLLDYAVDQAEPAPDFDPSTYEEGEYLNAR
jgi:hypothetical protein